MNKILLVVTFIAGAISSTAQDSLAVPRKLNYFFSVNTGLLGGERMKSLTFSANTVHGITLGKRLRLGVGVGIDSYQYAQTMPLFGHVSYDLLQFDKGSAIFLQVNYGWAHAWSQPEDSYLSYSTSGGKMFNTMLGYRFAAGNVRIALAAGYKYQETRSSYQSPFIIDYFSSSLYVPYSQVTEHNYERFTVMVGVGLR